MNAFDDPHGPPGRPRAAARLAALFDGQCGVCTRSSLWVGARDPGRGVERLDLRTAAAAARFPELSAEAVREQLHVVDADGRVWVGIEALGRLLRALPGWGWLGALLVAPGLVVLSGLAYRAFASRRLSFNRWFPLAGHCDETCSHVSEPAGPPDAPAPAAPPVPKFTDGRGFLRKP